MQYSAIKATSTMQMTAQSEGKLNPKLLQEINKNGEFKNKDKLWLSYELRVKLCFCFLSFFELTMKLSRAFLQELSSGSSANQVKPFRFIPELLKTARPNVAEQTCVNTVETEGEKKRWHICAMRKSIRTTVHSFTFNYSHTDKFDQIFQNKERTKLGVNVCVLIFLVFPMKATANLFL